VLLLVISAVLVAAASLMRLTMVRKWEDKCFTAESAIG